MTDRPHIQTLHLSDLCQNKPERPGWSLTFGATCAAAARVNMKLKQISPSDTVAPGYICVVEFGTPRSRIIEKCRT